MNLNQLRRLVVLYRSNELARLSPILIAANYAGHETELQSIIDLNRRVLGNLPCVKRSPRLALSMEAPRGTDGNILLGLEFVMFGCWLMIDGHPGLPPAPGPVADDLLVLRTVAVASAILHRRANPEHASSRKTTMTPKVMATKITAAQMRDHWDVMFNEQLDQAVFRSRLKSAARHLQGYLDHLAAQPLVLNEKSEKLRPPRSTRLEKVLLAMRGDKTEG